MWRRAEKEEEESTLSAAAKRRATLQAASAEGGSRACPAAFSACSLYRASLPWHRKTRARGRRQHFHAATFYAGRPV